MKTRVLLTATLGIALSLFRLSGPVQAGETAPGVYTNAEARRYQSAMGSDYVRYVSPEERARRERQRQERLRKERERKAAAAKAAESAATAAPVSRPIDAGEYAFAHPAGSRPACLVSHEGRLVDVTRVLEQEARRNGLDPLLLEVVIAHESAFNASAVSGVGAQGLMQLMPETAEMLGVADSFDPVQNVAGGARYLGEQLRRYGQVSLALAAYNAGPGAVDEYGGVPPYAETVGYVRSIVAHYRAGLKHRQQKVAKA